MGRIDDGLHRLALVLAEKNRKGELLIHEFAMSDFREFCIRTRLGMDARTSASWMRTAIAEDMIVVVRRNAERQIYIYKAGPRLKHFLDDNGSGST